MYWIDDGWDLSLWLTLILKGKRPFDRGGEIVWEINARSTPQVDRLWRSRESSEAGHPRLPTATAIGTAQTRSSRPWMLLTGLTGVVLDDRGH